MRTLGVEVVDLARGRVTLDLPFRADLCQQQGYVHAGALTSVVDSACGYAALSAMPPGREVLTVEFKVNLLAPGRAERFRATGIVVRSGRTLTICRGEVTAIAGGKPGSLVAVMQATMMAVDGTQPT
ncbi:MAG: PaaI family thioesterase [Streptosporangiaceae bacterium]